MSQNYKPKPESKCEYVDNAKAFLNMTTYRYVNLPREWDVPMLNPMMEAANQIYTNVNLANAVYINSKNLSDDQLIKAYHDRIEYLETALRYFKTFDDFFDRLFAYIGTVESEKQRLRGKIYQILREIKQKDPSVEKISTSVSVKAGSYVFVANDGVHHMTLNLTMANKSAWLRTVINAKNAIKNRISSDKKLLSSIREKTNYPT